MFPCTSERNTTIIVKRNAFIMLIILLLSGRLFAAQLTVQAAASLADAMKEIGATYEKESNDKVQFNFGASSLLARQVEQGAPADLFVSADEAKMDSLAQRGLLLDGTRRDLLTNLLVIIVPAQAESIPQSAADLQKPEYRKIALAETETVPAGIYARQYLQKLGLWDALVPKVVSTENVRGALAAVETGNAEAGFVYKTDALISKKVKVAVEISAGQGPKIVYPMAIVKSSLHPKEAQKFEEYFAGATATRILQKFGFSVVAASTQ